jgi:Trypsin-like peptidase domain
VQLEVLLRQLLWILLLIAPSARAAAGCIDPATLTHSTMSIMRHFDDAEKEARPGVLGIRATGWFLSPTSMATVEHVTAAMHLSDRDWKPVEIGTRESKQSIPARIRRVAGSSAHRIAVVELQTAFFGAQGLGLRMEPLVPEESVESVAYPNGDLRVAGGRFVQYGDGNRLAGAALLEMYDGNDRLVLDHGASGAPVFDCTGRVVAAVSNLFTTSMQFMSRTIFGSRRPGGNPTSFPCPCRC